MAANTTSDDERDAPANARGFFPNPELSFPAAFARRAAADPERPAFFDVTLGKADLTAIPQPCAAMLDRARAAASALVAAGVRPGDRVLLCLGTTSHFFSFLLATQAMGAVPVPLPCPSEFRAKSAFGERIEAVALDCAPRAIVVDSSEDVAAATGLAAAEGVVVLDASSCSDHAQSVAPLTFDRSMGEVAFIQYTSGSTGSPKGVVVTHQNLVVNMRAIAEAGRFGPADRSFNWLPLYHDMGLVGGFLIGLYLGIPTFVLPTRAFVARPDSWLQCMSKFRATFACAPNFAYNMMARRLPDTAIEHLDLSSWRLAFNGAEPIDRATVEDFLHRFGGVGLSKGVTFPVYGMAECTLAATFPVPGEPPRYDVIDRDVLARDRIAAPCAEGSAGALSFVGVGRALPGHRVRILEPDGTAELPERRVGEVVLSGASVTPYYFRRDGAYPAARQELRTGDLGYIADGDLFIVDRLKDLLIIGGRNIVPSDVERVVAGVPGIRYGSVVAFAIRGSEGTDELYLVAAVDPRQPPGAALEGAVKGAVFQHFGLTPKEVAFTKPSAIPKTSSGKVRRAACRELYLQHAFDQFDAASAAAS